MLHKYIVKVHKSNCDLFQKSLIFLSKDSEYKPGQRVQFIVPQGEQTAFGVDLTKDEVLIMALTCPGEYVIHTDAGQAEVNITFWRELGIGNIHI